MAVTRHAQHVQRLQASRQLRSGRNTVGIASHTHHVRKSRPPLSPLLWQADRRDQISISGQSDVPGEVDEDSGQLRGYNGSLLEKHALRSVGSSSNSRLDGMALSGTGAEPNPAAPSTLMSCSPTLDQSTAVGYTGSRMASSVQKSHPISPDDIGLPPSGFWDHDAAYEQRFCYEHGGFEYLLAPADRWMSPGDFDIPDAESALATLLEDNSSEFEPRTRRCQAECWGSLYSQVHSVVDRRVHGFETVYLVRWKACWTPESNIEDKSWIAPALKAHRDPNRRRSMRLVNSFEERMGKYEKVMVVVKLDRRNERG
ncbi:hypothetical protein LTR06_009552 [Exophiala xenobiotica]|nr:hypothetical protein LTR06_009552 [Exophiala xenobiotica]